MKVIFYDRKNKREVSNDQLLMSRLGQTVLSTDSDDLIDSDRRMNPKTYECMTMGEYLTYVREDWITKVEIARDGEWHTWPTEKVAKYIHAADVFTDTLVYKSEDCSSYKNWDLVTSVNDLVFLRFEDEEN